MCDGLGPPNAPVVLLQIWGWGLPGLWHGEGQVERTAVVADSTRSRHTRLMKAFHFGCSLIVGMGPRGQLSKHPFAWNWRLRRLGVDLPSEVQRMCQGHPVQLEALLPLTGPLQRIFKLVLRSTKYK
jgi:hypothetical protein